ncbi:MAG: purine nucleoside permease, partial [Pseudomonadales bacterium]
QRVLVLRTISNFTVQQPGKSVTWSTTEYYQDDVRPALEAAFVIGNTVVEAILTNWDTYKDQLPK